jgi:uracil-DNA glycosylase
MSVRTNGGQGQGQGQGLGLALTPQPILFGSQTPKVLFLGEAFGEREEIYQSPFCGSAGQELFRMISSAGAFGHPEAMTHILETMREGDRWIEFRRQWAEKAGVAFTNVFSFRPPANNIEALCAKRGEVSHSLAPIKMGQYIRDEYLDGVRALRAMIGALRPNLVVLLGNIPSWALLNQTAISSIRGAITESGLFDPPIKVLPTYHPAAVLRQWSLRPIVIADLIKATREAEYPEVRRPHRKILINPTIEEVESWTEDTIRLSPSWLSIDCETAKHQITCVSIAQSPSNAIVIPFVKMTRDVRGAVIPTWENYWPDFSHEFRAWKALTRLCHCGIPKLGQNFIYDIQYLRKHGIHPRPLGHDSMLLHHALYPELQKGLGFLGSIYSNEPAWKLMRRKRTEQKGEKADE